MSPRALLPLALAWAAASQPYSTVPRVRACDQVQDQSPSNVNNVVLCHLRLPDKSLPVGARVMLISTKSMLGMPTYMTEVIVGASDGIGRFERTPPGQYDLVARWEPRASARPPKPEPNGKFTPSPAADAVWWGFCPNISPGPDDHEIVLAQGEKQTILVKCETEVPVKKVRAVLALKSCVGLTPMNLRFPPPTLALVREATTKDGHLVLDGLAPGKWACVLSIPDYGRTGEFSLEVPAKDESEVVVPRFISIAGQVHAPEGVAVSHVWVGLEYEPTFTLIPEDGQVATTTDDSGAFLISHARPGRVKLKASAEQEHYMFEADLVLASGKDLEGIQINLAKRK
jgi:hypothetical protein